MQIRPFADSQAILSYAQTSLCLTPLLNRGTGQNGSINSDSYARDSSYSSGVNITENGGFGHQADDYREIGTFSVAAIYITIAYLLIRRDIRDYDRRHDQRDQQ